MELLATFFRDGGVFIYLILAVSIIGLAIVADRCFYLLFKYSINSGVLWLRVSKSVRDGNPQKARSYCTGSEAPVARLFDKGLTAYGKSEREVQNALDEVSLEVIPAIDKRVPYLAVAANVSTLLGLLGTIHGLIMAFSAVGNADPSQKATLLASGISIALYTTAFGLVVAIPLLIAYSLLQSRAHRIIDEVDEFSVKLINLLVHTNAERRKDGSQAQS
jgi:biopolymer transport protein ExbB/TolQ